MGNLGISREGIGVLSPVGKFIIGLNEGKLIRGALNRMKEGQKGSRCEKNRGCLQLPGFPGPHTIAPKLITKPSIHLFCRRLHY